MTPQSDISHKVESITPYDQNNRTKHEQVTDMFDSIAPAYDLMNRMMTFGLDKMWRHNTVKRIAKTSPRQILDIATGTADLAISMARKISNVTVTGIDLSANMIALGDKKIHEARLDSQVKLQVGDALALPFDNDSFDAITAAYGVRNFEHLDTGYAEMLRVLRPGGKLYILELTPPASPIVKPLYNFYTHCIIPLIGRMVSKDTRAYSYLPESIKAVPARNDMTKLMTDAGFANAHWTSMTLGVCTLYIATKQK